MDFQLSKKRFIVTGATSGLGKGVATALLGEGAHLILVAREQKRLRDMRGLYPGQVETLAGDMTQEETLERLMKMIDNRRLEGICVNAGGPPAKAFLETSLGDWDKAYKSILRWKVDLTRKMLPLFRKQGYGRLLYIESESVKQPVKNLVLSNSLRLAVVGFVKTLSQEVAHEGVTLNILAPGFHDTPAAQRLFIKRSEVDGVSTEEAKEKYTDQIPVGRMGNPEDFGRLAAWLLSPHSGYMTGQTISVDGGAVKGTMG